VAGNTGEKRGLARDALSNLPQRLLETGEPAAMKVAWEVREGAVGNGQEGTALAAYFTIPRRGWQKRC